MNISGKYVPKTLHRALTARVPAALDQQDRSPRSSAGILGYRLTLAKPSLHQVVVVPGSTQDRGTQKTPNPESINDTTVQ